MTRQHLDRIEALPKKVVVIDGFINTLDLKRRPDLAQALTDIRRCIEEGRPLPAGSYRASTGPDYLLNSHGIMHLHLGSSRSRELLYVVQYPDRMVFLALSDHVHLTTKPPGVVLNNMFSRKLAAMEVTVTPAGKVSTIVSSGISKVLGDKMVVTRLKRRRLQMKGPPKDPAA